MPWPPPDASFFLRASFTLLGLALALLVLVGIHRASRNHREPDRVRRRRVITMGVLAVSWMAGCWLVADAGLLARGSDGISGFVVLIPTMGALAVAFAFSPIGTLLASGLPLAVLVGFHAFRLPLELLMHHASSEGVMPVQMSYSGSNWDIVTGATAIVVALAIAGGIGGRRLVWGWNLMGFALLVNISVIAMRSTPIVAAYGPEHLNTWVAYPPFVWLPSVMVFLALAGHLVIFRALLSR